MMAHTWKLQTFSNVIEALISSSVLLPAELMYYVDEFIEDNRQLGYAMREEFIREAVVEKFNSLSEARKLLLDESSS